MRVTTAAEVPRQNTPKGGLTLGKRLAAAGVKPAKIDDRRQATHLASTLKPQTLNPTETGHRDARDIQSGTGPRGVQISMTGVARSDRLSPTVAESPRRKKVL